MVGSGAVVFAVMGYVIAMQVPDKEVGSQVRLNPILLSTILGEERGDVQKAIDYLCAPDPKSSTKIEQGRRLIKLGEFDYRVVNGAKYRAIRDEEQRREQNRIAKRRERAKRSDKNAGLPLKGEGPYVTILERDGQEAADKWLAQNTGQDGMLKEKPGVYRTEPQPATP